MEAKGQKGEKGAQGIQGKEGEKGPKGETGKIGEKGSTGQKGDIGLPGLPGKEGKSGQKGTSGINGANGEIGPPGSIGDKGPPGNSFSKSGIMLARHSQDQNEPECPANTVKMWNGYSLLYLSGNEKSHQQDLGSAGSCLRIFSVMPFIRCDIGNNCYFAQNNDLSYWLSTNMAIPKTPMEGLEIQKHISRCTVCEAPSNVISVHSQTGKNPQCPDGWSRLWDGYSFVMVRIFLNFKQQYNSISLCACNLTFSIEDLVQKAAVKRFKVLAAVLNIFVQLHL